ncbi:MAG: hypothetical protein CMD99_09895 [Gammaproteobacteria bacterium]|nr:hypothetical protein [Gammaproteobacteria bacterium]
MTSPFGLIQFDGDKTLQALQGQCTQSVTSLTSAEALLVAFCDPKGRMYGSGRLLQYEGIISLITPLDQAAVLLKRLRPFLLLSKVSARLTSIAVSLVCSPALPPGVIQCSDKSIMAGEFGETQWEIGDGSHTHDPEADLKRLHAGLGFVRQESCELCIPQQAHYQMLGGVNFDKGCYTGQEVIARLEYLGQAKKYLFRYQNVAAAPGEIIEIDGTDCTVFDSTKTRKEQVALILAPVTSKSEQLTGVPFTITRQVKGQRPVKLR